MRVSRALRGVTSHGRSVAPTEESDDVAGSQSRYAREAKACFRRQCLSLFARETILTCRAIRAARKVSPAKGKSRGNHRYARPRASLDTRSSTPRLSPRFPSLSLSLPLSAILHPRCCRLRPAAMHPSLHRRPCHVRQSAAIQREIRSRPARSGRGDESHNCIGQHADREPGTPAKSMLPLLLPLSLSLSLTCIHSR